MIIIKFFVLCNVFKFCGLFGVKGIMFLINDIFFNVIIKKNCVVRMVIVDVK